MTPKKDISANSSAQGIPSISFGRQTEHARTVGRLDFGVQFVKFSAIGILNTGLHYCVFIVLYSLAGINYLVASTAGYCVGVGNSYVMNRRWTFGSRNDRIFGELARFIAVNLASLGTNAGLLFALVTIANLQPQIAQIGAIIGSMSVNFICNKFWTFGSVKIGSLPE